MIKVYDMQILGHIQAMGATTAVDFMTAVIHGKANQSIMVLPVILDQIGQHRKNMIIEAQFCRRFTFSKYVGYF